MRDACELCVFCNIYIYIFVLYFVVVLDRRSRDDCAKTGFWNQPTPSSGVGAWTFRSFDHLLWSIKAASMKASSGLSKLPHIYDESLTHITSQIWCNCTFRNSLWSPLIPYSERVEIWTIALRTFFNWKSLRSSEITIIKVSTRAPRTVVIIIIISLTAAPSPNRWSGTAHAYRKRLQPTQLGGAFQQWNRVLKCVCKRLLVLKIHSNIQNKPKLRM